MPLKFSCLIITLFIFSISYSQTYNVGDTVLANEYYHIGDSTLQAAVDYEAAIQFFKKASTIYKALGLKLQYLDCLNKLTENYRRLNQFDSAYFFVDVVLKESESGSKIAAKAYEQLGFVENRKNNLDKALTYFYKALKIRRNDPGTNARDMVDPYFGIGLINAKKGHDKIAEGFYLRAIDYYKKSPYKNNYELDKLYYNIALVYSSSFQHNLALEYNLRALAIENKIYPPYHRYIADSYINIGVNYVNCKRNTEAHKYFNKALSIYKTIKVSNAKIALIYFNIASTYQLDKKHNLAIKTCLRGVEILQKDPSIYGKTILATCYFLIGKLYSELGYDQLALKYLKKSLHLRKSIFGVKHPKVEHVYAEIGMVYSKRKEYGLALNHLQEALIANVIDFNNTSVYASPSLSNYMDADALFGTLRDKGITFYGLYEKNSELKDLETALKNFQLCDKLVDKRLTSYVNRSDKAFLEQYAKPLYKNAIKVCLVLFNNTKNNEYRELAFYFSQKSKANVILEAINSKSGKQQDLLPNNLKQLEGDLNLDISYYQSLRLQALTDEKDSVKFNEYNEKLFNLNRKLDSLVQSLEKAYPRYYDIKYNYETLSLAEVQSKLKKQEALLEYFSTEEGTYAFAVSKDTIIIEELPAITKDEISTLQHSLKPEFFLKNQQKAFEAYTQVAYKLYQDQVEPLLSNFQGIKKLYVIPNGPLHQVPFELLLSGKPDSDQKQQYRELSYLIKHYNISYAYSVTLLFKEHLLPDVKKKSGVLAFAPNYSEQIMDTVDLQILGKFRDEVTPLKWNQTELQSISQYFEGEFLHSEMATEKMFNERINDYNIVHLAMHALVDDEDPMNSKLVFSHATDSLNDSYLHSFEIYSKHINTQLAVLSACNTGSGELHSSEGLMSLARAFQYAGCPSVVMSHWRVDDKSSSIIMGEFYRYLAEGKNKDEALRMAKLNYLDQASPLGQHPFYWNSFVVMGNIKPIAQNENHKVWYWAFGGIGLIFLLVLGTAAYTKRKQ